MHARLKTIVGLAAFALIGVMAMPAAAAVRIFTLDAVELVKNGKELEGDAKYSVVRDGYTYHFASAENKKAFEAEPTRFELQMGGACGRMGPLSGSGKPSLYAVHDGRLYLFASKQCRTAFLAAPDKFIEKDDPPVTGDAAAMKRGKELLDMAVKAHGGTAAIDGVKSYRQIREEVVTQAGAKYDYKYMLTIAYPDRIRDEFCWNDNCSWHTVNAARGAEWTRDGFDKPMSAAQIDAAKRKAGVNLLSILKARGKPDFTTAYLGGEKAGEAKVERVGVSFDRLTYCLGIDPTTGRVRTLEYTGRGGERDVIGKVLLTFVDYDTIDGLTLPTSWTTSFDGGPPGKTSTRLSKAEINPKIDEKVFDVDEPK